MRYVVVSLAGPAEARVPPRPGVSHFSVTTALRSGIHGRPEVSPPDDDMVAHLIERYPTSLLRTGHNFGCSWPPVSSSDGSYFPNAVLLIATSTRIVVATAGAASSSRNSSWRAHNHRKRLRLYGRTIFFPPTHVAQRNFRCPLGNCPEGEYLLPSSAFSLAFLPLVLGFHKLYDPPVWWLDELPAVTCGRVGFEGYDELSPDFHLDRFAEGIFHDRGSLSRVRASLASTSYLKPFSTVSGWGDEPGPDVRETEEIVNNPPRSLARPVPLEIECYGLSGLNSPVSIHSPFIRDHQSSASPSNTYL
jgi:hypothetical protein